MMLNILFMSSQNNVETGPKWLTHCGLGDFNEILYEYFEANYNDW